jgi:predicted Zn-dependent peptidase
MRNLKAIVHGFVLAALFGCSSACPEYEYALLGPKLSEEKAQPEVKPAKPVDESWRKAEPSPGPTPSPVIPEFTETGLANGLEVIVSQRTELPLVSVAFAIQAGSASDGKARAGLADFTYELMLEGAGKRDGVELAEAFADLGAEISVGTEEDGAAFNITVLKKNLKPCIELVSDIIMRPSFAPKDFARKQKERVANIERHSSMPNYLSAVGLSMEMFGASHPYGHPGLGTLKSVKNTKLSDLKSFHRRNVAPASSALIFAGDIDSQEASKLAEEFFGGWKGPKGQALAAKSKVDVTPRDRVAVISMPGLNQTVIAMGTPSIEAGNEKEWALSMAVDVFGGMFGSRLNMNLREDKGYTYGARASLNTYRYSGALTAASSVHAQFTGAALEEFMKELNGMSATSITQKEFEAARDNVLRSISGWFESTSGISDAAERIFFCNLPMDRYEKMVQGYSGLTLTDAQEAAQTYLIPQNMKIVLVGDKDVIKEQVSKLNLGELKEVSL